MCPREGIFGIRDDFAGVRFVLDHITSGADHIRSGNERLQTGKSGVIPTVSEGKFVRIRDFGFQVWVVLRAGSSAH